MLVLVGYEFDRALHNVGCASQKCRSGGGRVSLLPEVLELAADAAATKSDDPVGSLDGPEHSRLLETGPDDRLAASLDDTGADKQALRTEIRIAHLGRVAFEVFSLGVQLLSQFRPLADERADDGYERLDFALVQQIHRRCRPTSAHCFVARKQEPGEFVEMLAGMVEVHDQNGSGKLFRGNIPDPDSAISQNHLDARP